MTSLIVWYYQFKLKYLQKILNSMLLPLLIQFHHCPYHCRISVYGLKASSLICFSEICFGHNSANNSYSLGGVLLNRVYDNCDLGVHITSEFKSSLKTLLILMHQPFSTSTCHHMVQEVSPLN